TRGGPTRAGWPRPSESCWDAREWWALRFRGWNDPAAFGLSLHRGFTLKARAWRRSHRNWTSSRGASTRSGGRFDIDRKRARVELIERESVQPGFWEDQKRAQALSKEKSDLEMQLAQYERERQRLDDAIALHELAEEANDAATWEESKLAMAEAVEGA